MGVIILGASRGSALECWSISPAVDPAPGTRFITKFIPLFQVVPNNIWQNTCYIWQNTCYIWQSPSAIRDESYDVIIILSFELHCWYPYIVNDRLPNRNMRSDLESLLLRTRDLYEASLLSSVCIYISTNCSLCVNKYSLFVKYSEPPGKMSNMTSAYRLVVLHPN